MTRACRTAVRHTPWVILEHTYDFALCEQSPCGSTLLAHAAETHSLLVHTGVLSYLHDQRAQSCDGRLSNASSRQNWVMLLPCMCTLPPTQVG